jgi:poly(3-hydroxybutyrate) depolymerase
MRYFAIFLFLLVSAETAKAGDVNPTPTPGLTPSPARQPTPTLSPSGSAGCGKEGQATGTFGMTISDGQTPNRSYILQVPSNYNPQVPLPIVMVFHGLGGTPQGAMAFGIQNAPGASDSAIFVFPQGSVYTGTTAEVYGQVGWYDHCGSVDMTFVKNILASTEANYCVDQKRVFAAGFSWGCDFVTALNCCEGTLFRGISAASCADEFNKDVVADVNDPSYYLNYYNLNSAGMCPGKGGAAIRFTHDSSEGDTAYGAPSFTWTSYLYRSINSCSNMSTPVDSTTLAPVSIPHSHLRDVLDQRVTNGVIRRMIDKWLSSSVCSSFNNCASPFVECSYRNLGHALPANWGSDTWQFFSSFK